MRAAYSTGDLARATGHTLRTIRHYEAAGLLAPSEVSDGGHRRYTEEDLERLRLIIDLRELGLSLCEIKSMLELRSGCQTAAEFAARFRQVIEVHLEAAQRRLERLRRMRREILASLTMVEARLHDMGGTQCPCAVAGDEQAPRIVKVLARQAGCGCGGLVHPDHAGAHGGPPPGAALLSGPPPPEPHDEGGGLEPTGHA
jgi:DNA-binding transcriptional MerR regulator